MGVLWATGIVVILLPRERLYILTSGTGYRMLLKLSVIRGKIHKALLFDLFKIVWEAVLYTVHMRMYLDLSMFLLNNEHL